MKGCGIMVCSMAKVCNFSRMGNDSKEISKRINSMAMVFSTKMIRLFMEFGRTMNYRL